jgi:hypothetical protein
MGRMSFTQELKALAKTSEEMDTGGPPGGAGRIRFMDEERVIQADATRPKSALREDRARVEMIAREKRMTVEQRVELFERLSRDAAWIRSSAKRIR